MTSAILPSCLTRTCALGLLALTLAGCALPERPVRPTVFDFGPGPLHGSAPQPARPTPLLVAAIEANPALDGTAVLYRLAYADDQQLKAYARARWSMTPAQLLRQRLHERLGQHRPVLNPGEGGSPAAATLTLHLELEEFSQLFETPEQSTGLLRLRATVIQRNAGNPPQLAQRTLIVQRPAPSADVAGGVRALTAATDAALQELEQWLLQFTP